VYIYLFQRGPFGSFIERSLDFFQVLNYCKMERLLWTKYACGYVYFLKSSINKKKKIMCNKSLIILVSCVRLTIICIMRRISDSMDILVYACQYSIRFRFYTCRFHFILLGFNFYVLSYKCWEEVFFLSYLYHLYRFFNGATTLRKGYRWLSFCESIVLEKCQYFSEWFLKKGTLIFTEIFNPNLLKRCATSSVR